MASKTEICNLALSHLKIGREIANIETENSEAANACRRFFDISCDAVLRDFNWPFATKEASLSLVEETPTTEWAYSYQYPTDCIQLRRIHSGARKDTRASLVRYLIRHSDAGSLIYTDQSEPVMEYTVRVVNVEQYPVDFQLALSWRIAMYVAARLTGGDPFKLRQLAEVGYRGELAQARANALNEEQNEDYTESEFITERE